MNYQVNTIYSTIQGEGCLTGIPMVLLRLQGCDVRCPWCDTRETWNPKGGYQTNVEDLLSEVQELRGSSWVLLTGGEPAEQDLSSLVNALHSTGYKVALETSGTANGCLGVTCDWVCVSPKQYKDPLPEVVAMADELKVPVCYEDDIIWLDDFLLAHELKSGCQVCLQPVSQSATATELCVKTVQERGWRLSVQVHKYLNLP